MRSIHLIGLVILCTLMEANGGVVKRSDDVNADMQTLQTLVQQQAAAITSLQATVSSLQASVNILNNQQATVNNLQAKMTGLENTVQTLSKPVAFTAMFSHDDYNEGVPLGLHQILQFDRVVTNAGNGYNPTTGIFRAPLAGYYAFSIVAMEPNGATHSSLALGLVKNGGVVDQAWIENSQNVSNEQGSTHTVLHLAAGDQVWIRQDGYGDAVRGGTLTVFTGYLVHAE